MVGSILFLFFTLVVEVWNVTWSGTTQLYQVYITLHCACIYITTNTISDTVNCWPDWFSSLLPPVWKSSSSSLLVLPWSHDFYCTEIFTRSIKIWFGQGWESSNLLLFLGRLIDNSAMGWSNINFVVDCLKGNTSYKPLKPPCRDAYSTNHAAMG